MRVFLAAALFPLSACSFGLTLEPPDIAGYGDTGGLLDPSDDGAGDGADDGADDGAGGGGGGGGGNDDGDDALPETAVDLSGKLYSITPDDVRVTMPPGLDAMWHEIMQRDVLVYVEGETDDALMLDVALAGVDGAQDPCEAVRSFPAADWSANPRFEAGPGELGTSFGGHPATFRDLALAGTFDEYAFQWRDGTLDAELDTRELAPALPEMSDLCGLVEDLGGACKACTDGEVACFDLRLEEITAVMVDGTFEPDNRGDDCR